MPTTLLTARLEIVDAQIALARANIEAQANIIESMREKGFATGDAETHLTIIQASLASHLAEQARLHAQLAALRR